MDEEASGAERAFKELQSEVLIVRRALEALPAAWKATRAADTTPTLVEIAQTLKQMGQHLEMIEQHPALRLTPQQHQIAVGTAGEAVMRQAIQTLDRSTRDVKAGAQQIAAIIGTMRGQQQQWAWLIWVGIGSLVLGLALSPMLSALLPFGLDGRIAAFIMKADRWEAGGALMAADDPKAWTELGEGAQVWKGNKAAIEACREAAAKTKKEQRCTVVVPAPAS